MLFLLWGDLTYNNTGKVRYDSNTLYTNFSDKLCKVNKELNKKEIIKSIISKYLFSDDIITKKINYILYYNNKWKVISFDKLINLLTNTNFNYEKIIYSGPLIIQSKARNLNFKKEYANTTITSNCVTELKDNIYTISSTIPAILPSLSFTISIPNSLK